MKPRRELSIDDLRLHLPPSAERAIGTHIMRARLKYINMKNALMFLDYCEVTGTKRQYMESMFYRQHMFEGSIIINTHIWNSYN